MARPPKAAIDIANHLGMDVDDMEDNYRYQPTRYTRPVYLFDSDYWSAGPTPPRYTQGRCDLKWRRVVSSYDKKTLLWHAVSVEE